MDSPRLIKIIKFSALTNTTQMRHLNRLKPICKLAYEKKKRLITQYLRVNDWQWFFGNGFFYNY